MMNYSEFEELMSKPRLARYRASCCNDVKKTRQLYRTNIKISQAFLAVISIFEVILRNKIDKHYKEMYKASECCKGSEWLTLSAQPGGFLSNSACMRSTAKIAAAHRELGPTYSHDKLLAKLTIGFWKYMFAGHQFVAGGSSLLSIFPNLPAGINQSNVYKKLDRINTIRNRVAHHEPVCFGIGNNISSQYSRSRYGDIVDLLDWMQISADSVLYGIDHVLKEAGHIDDLEHFLNTQKIDLNDRSQSWE